MTGGGLDRDGVVRVRDSRRARQLGRFEAQSCSCHRHGDNKWSRRGVREHEEELCLELVMLERAFKVDAQVASNDANLVQNIAVWRRGGIP